MMGYDLAYLQSRSDDVCEANTRGSRAWDASPLFGRARSSPVLCHPPSTHPRHVVQAKSTPSLKCVLSCLSCIPTADISRRYRSSHTRLPRWTDHLSTGHPQPRPSSPPRLFLLRNSLLRPSHPRLLPLVRSEGSRPDPASRTCDRGWDGENGDPTGGGGAKEVSSRPFATVVSSSFESELTRVTVGAGSTGSRRLRWMIVLRA